ncbi:MAG: hypothetical protein IJY99_00015 [Alphaproteobacteria bacterium]|nr:hypothetical protein [Alphaproteobacteria bacterium]
MHLFRKRSHISYPIKGDNNQILLDNADITRDIRRLRIMINGNNNTIIISSKAIFKHTSNIHITGNNNFIQIGDGDIGGVFYIFIHGDRCQCIWGDNTTAVHTNIIIGEDDSGCIIGNDCMLANADIRASDGHTIIDTETGKVLNRSKGFITIGNNCWIGQNCILTKNARLPDNTIVGAMSLVTKEFTATNTLIAGAPAQILRYGVKCSKLSPSNYLKSIE